MMAVIGRFKASKQGGWEGAIQTLAFDRKVRFVPNDDRVSDLAPAFRVMLGWQRIGDAWEARTSGDQPRDYLSVRIDDPGFAQPLHAALFWELAGENAQLVWSRSRGARV